MTVLYDLINSATASLLLDFIDDISEAQPLFSVYNYTEHIYERNPNCWLNSLAPGLAPHAVWNSTHGITGGPVLISPIHILTCAHTYLAIGTEVKFVKSDNTVITRTVVNTWRASSSFVGAYNDISVSLLDEEVPSEIGYFKVLPSDLTDYMPQPEGYLALPAVEINRLRVSGIECITTLGEDPDTLAEGRSLSYTDINFTTSWVTAITYNLNSYAYLYNQWEVQQGGGDSGNPMFLVINGELVLLTMYSTIISGVAINYWIDEVNEAMADMQGGVDPYQLNIIDLSMYHLTINPHCSYITKRYAQMIGL